MRASIIDLLESFNATAVWFLSPTLQTEMNHSHQITLNSLHINHLQKF